MAESDSFERDASRAAGIATWSWDGETGRIVWGRGAESALGACGETLPSSLRKFLRLVPRPERGRVLRAITQPEAQSGPVMERFQWTVPGGDVRVVQGRGDCVRRGNGSSGLWQGTLHLEPVPEAPAGGPSGGLTDSTTGIATLVAFREHVRRGLARARRRGDMLGIVLLDLDRFGRVNERYGHPAGDRLLRKVAGRLQRSVRDHDAVLRVREGDEGHHGVSRVGGDKFVIMLEDLTSSHMAASVVKRILRELGEPFSIGNETVTLTARAGISLFPIDGLEEIELLMHAETAIQRTRTGAGPIKFFSRAAALRHQREIDLEQGLRESIAADSFCIAYQPKVRIPDCRPIGFEALLRYEHPEQGPVPAGAVIDLAERTGLIHDLGRAIFRRVCVDSQRLFRETGAENVRIFTNFSPLQLDSPDWMDNVRRTLEETGVEPRRVGIEITESLFVDNRASLVESLRELAERGLELSLDDFGTGYSSLAYLTRLPLHELKIDRSFVLGLSEESPGSREVAGLLIILGRTLGLRVVAEGIETEEQREMLRSMGCKIMQGFYYSRPKPLEHFFESVRSGTLKPAGPVAPEPSKP